MHASAPPSAKKGGIKAAAKEERTKATDHRMICADGPMYFGCGKIPPKTNIQYKDANGKLIHIVTVNGREHKQHMKIVYWIGDQLAKQRQGKEFALKLKRLSLEHWPHTTCILNLASA